MSGARPPPRAQQQQAQQDQSGGLIVFSGFSGLNTQASRIGIEDTQAAWMDGWFPQGTDNARIIFDHGAPIFTAPNFINSYQFGNI
jgi:hypothetical protein